MVRERVGDWRSVWRFALAGLLASVLVVATSQTAVVAPLFYALQDQLFPAPPPSSQVTLVALDSTAATPFGPYPWGNDIHAKVINYLASLHPKVILFDVMLDHSGPGDAQLAKAISDAGNVVLVCTHDDPPLPIFSSAAAAVAGRELGVPDPANAVRGVPIHIAKSCDDNPGGLPAFVQAVRIAEGPNELLTTNRDEATLGQHTIPLVSGEMLINFTNGKSPTCGYLAAFKGRCPSPSLITNHIVVVGIKLVDADDVYAQTVSFNHDSSFCPTSRPKCMVPNQNYGYRIMGDAISTVLGDRPIQPQPDSSDLLATLLMGTLIGAAVYLLSFRRAMLVTAVILAAYALLAIVLGRSGWLVDPIYTPVAIVLAAGFSLAARYVLVERERRKVERIFGHWVDPRIAQKLASSRSVEDIISKGERRDITLLFVDIRGFTALSEGMSAEDVQAVIHEYLDDMSSLILKWDGTIDKYVGDEIVALWNAPVDQRDHALLAVRCAYDLVNHAPILEARLAKKGLPPISWGIGVNTGPAVVGNMGSKDRLQYTALGDTVNTASRFCGAAPAFNLLIGWTTFQACSDLIAVDEMPGLQLKGKSAETFRLFNVTAIRQDKTSPWVQFPTAVAMSSYSERRRRS
ncbi:MAG TPA: adenylate/guanylate cyclase domain-containing protein [Candidatus Dormibacteraeota bacterium]|nr:adenylate/guanylate cyclase domain-containing protein [Candidatus Dormibacteraeota bacterium]